MLLGAHTSTAGGLYRALERGHELGAECVQLFSKNQQQWASKPLTRTDIRLFRETTDETGIKSIVHDSYLINLGQPDEQKRKQSIKAFREEMERADALGAIALVFHPGASLRKMSDEECCDIVADSLNIALDGYEGSCKAAIENTAGQGSNIGWRFEHSARIIEGVHRKELIATCFDTCHAFSAGYDLRDEATYAATFEEYDKVVGIRDRLIAFHINDCKVELGKRVDRHENLGFGFIGEECFKLLVNDNRFDGIIGCLETPMEDNGGHERDLELLRQFKIASS
ncbi:MAG: deoxyribonuclease IV [Nitrospira sp.]|nr:deoxyribonuclease IV [Nitrospira sp.]